MRWQGINRTALRRNVTPVRMSPTTLLLPILLLCCIAVETYPARSHSCAVRTQPRSSSTPASQLVSVKQTLAQTTVPDAPTGLKPGNIHCKPMSRRKEQQIRTRYIHLHSHSRDTESESPRCRDSARSITTQDSAGGVRRLGAAPARGPAVPRLRVEACGAAATNRRKKTEKTCFQHIAPLRTVQDVT